MFNDLKRGRLTIYTMLRLIIVLCQHFFFRSISFKMFHNIFLAFIFTSELFFFFFRFCLSIHMLRVFGSIIFLVLSVHIIIFLPQKSIRGYTYVWNFKGEENSFIVWLKREQTCSEYLTENLYWIISRI